MVGDQITGAVGVSGAANNDMASGPVSFFAKDKVTESFATGVCLQNEKRLCWI